MPKLSLYIDSALYAKLISKAKEKGVSVSGYVSGILKEHLFEEWPNGYFDLFGSLEDDPLELPEESPWSLDSRREAL